MKKEKDYERASRLNEVYKHLFAHFGIKSKTNFADVLHVQRTGLSAALNGSKANLTDNLFAKICQAFPGVFNLDYLLTGNGQLLTQEEDAKCDEIERGFIRPDVEIVSEQSPEPLIPSWADAFFSIMTQQVKDNEALNRELRQSISQVNHLRDELTMLLSILKN